MNRCKTFLIWAPLLHYGLSHENGPWPIDLIYFVNKLANAIMFRSKPGPTLFLIDGVTLKMIHGDKIRAHAAF